MTMDNNTNRVIVAENDPQMRGILRSMLNSVEQKVFVAADGLEAVLLARQFQARLVLLDIAMPRQNGLLTCKEIHELPGYGNVPIVMLTGHDDDRLRTEARRHGASAFITKPFRPSALLARLSAYIDLPVHMRSTLAIMWGEDEAAPARRALEWPRPADGAATQGDHPDLREGLESMRISRNAERKH